MKQGLVRTGTAYFFMIVAAALILLPFWIAVSNSFMTESESATYPPRFLPSGIHIDNFITVMNNIPIIRFIVNSFLTSSIITVGNLITSCMAAYAFAFLRFPGRKILFGLFMATMMIPWEVTVIPNYLTVRSWGWLDSYQGLTVPFLATAFGTFLMRQFFLQLPKELMEAARIDGCGHIRIFASLAVPLSMPGLATLGIYSFLNHWNMYLWPLLITNSESMRTVQIGISMLQFADVTAWNVVMAGIVLVMLPSLVLLAVGLGRLVGGLTAGALKG
ncbi:sn-glycerol-3-phosphate transport system permease protein [Paenibacillus nuruki]|uniref:sn-glycerol-3-phosphate transport system permease protein n=1 Tax=Paenibacillus nuruki TaxID=1886670 RepID=A0A1E3L2J6_9BACL|nr:MULTISPECIES: carbohydrate ABC transporter permease [Paenibacillus]ODP27190.1 sn-glycerol-3-phosphate transport system permease protein [Paenibacillus nuruki]TKJ92874.1 carbohydrate ABC transporter permease [Paenibacillus sp. CFBP13512]CAJ1314960.1 sn-glycerol-3-phosphate transport system permease protein [Paenibacillus nuruki]